MGWTDADLTWRLRAGRPVTRAMKIATLASRGEIEVIVAGVAEFGPPLDQEETALLARQWRRATGIKRRT